MGDRSEIKGERPLALSCLDYLDLEPEGHIRVAAEAGFDHVTLRVAGSRGQVSGDVSADPRRLARVRNELDATRLSVLDVEVVRMDSNLYVDAVARALDLAAELEAQHLLVVNSALEIAAAVDKLGAIVQRAIGSGVLPCLEPMPFSACRTLGEAIATAAPVGAGVLVDPLHLHRSGGGVADLRHALTGDAAHFPYVQMCDARVTAREIDDGALREEAVSGRLLPGDGELPLIDLIGVLPRGCPLAVEAPTRELAEAPARVRADAAMQAVTTLLRRS